MSPQRLGGPCFLRRRCQIGLDEGAEGREAAGAQRDPGRHGMTAPQCAGVIHTDFERGFIRAEVIGYEDFVKYRGEQGAKDAGKWRLEGKEYVMHDGDVVHFRFNV